MYSEQIAPAVRSLYIHIPFCFHKCHYCDFYSFVDTQDRQGPMVERLVREIVAQAPMARGEVLETVFVGGGTPSLLRPDLWERLLAAMHAAVRLGPLTEFTVECNPETVTPELMAVLRGGGVNRVSIGAQSFEPRHLRTLERWHDPENVARAVSLAADAGIERQSVDLIYAIPGQTLEEWDRDLERALALGTTHVSCYNLTYEHNTAMAVRLQRGEFEPTPEDLEIEMFERTGEVLARRGLERYEVSNYAAPGAEARHNLAYWRQASWLACGPSASGHLRLGALQLGSVRWKNVPRLEDYLRFDDGGLGPIADLEAADGPRLVREAIMTGLRLREGADCGTILEAAGALDPSWPDRLRAAADRQREMGLLDADEARWRVTARGWLMADGVAGALMAAIDRPPSGDRRGA